MARTRTACCACGGPSLSEILVAGAGAIGCWLAARLDTAGHDVQLLGRQPLWEGVRRGGLLVEGHTTHRFAPIVHTSVPDAVFDAVFVTCKAHATEEMARQVAGTAPVLATMQNGIGNGGKLAAHAGRDAVAVCLTSHGVTREGPARVRHAGVGGTVVGAMADADVEAARVAERLLDDAGLMPAWTDDVRGAVWTKAAVNAAINPLGAVHGTPNGRVLQDHWPRAKALAEEVYALSRAAGVRLHDEPATATRRTLEATAANRCSMLQDVAARRPTEIDQITGHFVRTARRLGFPLAENEAMYRAVVALEATYLDEGYLLGRVRAEAAGAWT